jgi:hypothetical protein
MKKLMDKGLDDDFAQQCLFFEICKIHLMIGSRTQPSHEIRNSSDDDRGTKNLNALEIILLSRVLLKKNQIWIRWILEYHIRILSWKFLKVKHIFSARFDFIKHIRLDCGQGGKKPTLGMYLHFELYSCHCSQFWDCVWAKSHVSKSSHAGASIAWNALSNKASQ